MGKTLLLVESPTKAKKLQGFLGADYVVQATFGHMMDLPAKELGVDLTTMEESYVVLESKGRLDYADLIKKIKKLAKEADRVVIASDPDREGEAIAWHVHNLLKLQENNYDRIELNEITPKGLERAMQARRKIDQNWVGAQRARRVLDRMMGYGISPVLMRAIDNAKSAGRVQSAALRMIVERDREHEKFRPEDRYSIEGTFSQQSIEFKTYLLRTAGVFDYAEPLEGDAEEAGQAQEPGSKKRKKRFVSAKPVDGLVQALKDVPDNEWAVVDVDTHQSIINPKPPLITSTLQQLGSRRFGWSGEQTMKVAQKLFENGFITYMRTDSVRIADEAQEEARAYLAANYGVDMVPDKPNSFKNKDAAQNAHEAIRPTHVEDASAKVSVEEDQAVNNIDARMLYDAIHEVFLCSQAAPGTNNITVATVEDTDAKFQFEASLTVWDFAGWRAISQEEPKPNGQLAAKNGPAQFINALAQKTQTKPKPRYKEESLIQDLEKNGVGRPSSYANILKTLNQRTYVATKGKDLISTELGRKATDWLIERAGHFTDVHYTAQMEERLDKIAEGKEKRILIMEEVRDDLKKTFNAFQERGAGTPSPKQKEFLDKIKERGDVVPEEAYATMKGAKEFLDTYMAARGPSEKQVQFALNLAQSTGMEYNDSMRMSANLTKKFIDEAMAYAQKHNIRTGGGSDRPATEKQIEMAKKLAAEQSVAWDSALEQSMTKISAFIDERMKNRPAGGGGGGGTFSGADRPATEKQIAMAENLAKRLGVDYPAAHKKSMQKTSAFIDKHMKK